jgi:cell fate (sporulation/competence/biofilm development) regulator YlbF (YheA/YmcA/DUF963 family)
MQTATANGNAVLTKTRELCQAILDEPDFKSVRRDVESFLSDDEAKSQYEKLSERGEYLHHKQHQGLALSGEEITEYESLREKFLANPIARSFLNAQEKMQQVQQTVGQYVSKTLETGRVPTESDLADEGGCGSGCGCGHNH